MPGERWALERRKKMGSLLTIPIIITFIIIMLIVRTNVNYKKSPVKILGWLASFGWALMIVGGLAFLLLAAIPTDNAAQDREKVFILISVLITGGVGSAIGFGFWNSLKKSVLPKTEPKVATEEIKALKERIEELEGKR